VAGPSPTGSSTTLVHTVAAGETLGQIALRYYNDANRWQRIYEANRSAISDPNALVVGTRLTIPPRE
jgi:nucleoid-associated protein YgaU